MVNKLKLETSNFLCTEHTRCMLSVRVVKISVSDTDILVLLFFLPLHRASTQSFHFTDQSPSPHLFFFTSPAYCLSSLHSNPFRGYGRYSRCLASIQAEKPLSYMFTNVYPCNFHFAPDQKWKVSRLCLCRSHSSTFTLVRLSNRKSYECSYAATTQRRTSYKKACIENEGQPRYFLGFFIK